MKEAGDDRQRAVAREALTWMRRRRTLASAYASRPGERALESERSGAGVPPGLAAIAVEAAGILLSPSHGRQDGRRRSAPTLVTLQTSFPSRPGYPIRSRASVLEDPSVGIGAFRRFADRLRARGRRRVPRRALARTGSIRRWAVRAADLPLRDVDAQRCLRGLGPRSHRSPCARPGRRSTYCARTLACPLSWSSRRCPAWRSRSLDSSLRPGAVQLGLFLAPVAVSHRAAAAFSPRSGRPDLASMSSARWRSRRQSSGRFSSSRSSRPSGLPGSSSRPR